MIKVTTSEEMLIFNLSSYDSEKRFKEDVLNHVIDQTGKQIKIRFKHPCENRQVGQYFLKTKNVRKVEFTKQKYIGKNSYSVKFIVEEMCQSKK